jgi:Phasin protein
MTTMSKRSSMSSTVTEASKTGLPKDKSDALARSAEMWLTTTSECQREMMEFVSMRLEKDSETAREVLDSKSLADVAAIQSRWIEETIRDYNSEMSKIVSICTNAVKGDGHGD